VRATTNRAPRGAGDVEAIIATGGPALAERMARVEARLTEIAAEAGGPLGPQARDTVAARGKRLRPLLVLLAAEAAGGARASAGDRALVRAAVAVELVHSATLVHDDILDGADLRRGRPTVVASAGRAMAVATGDLLFARAFAELAGNGSAAQLGALSDASSALAEGELLQRADSYDVGVEFERYLRRCELKTAALFEAACRLGALARAGAGAADAADVAVADELGAFARRIGVAFQLLDDVLDVSGPASRTGKHRGTDLLDGTVTLPLILARERDRVLADLDLRSLEGPAAAERVCDRIAATGALKHSKARALGIVEDAKAGLPAGLPARQRQLLELVADTVVERYR
jgi:geranylgeranyl pyrophosphate synthase